MASVPTVSGPQVTLSGEVGSGGFSVDRAPGDLVTGQNLKEASQASSELQKAINDAYISASDARANQAYLDLQDSVKGIMYGQNGALNKQGTEVTNGRDKKSFSDYYGGQLDKSLEDASKGLDPYQKRLLFERSKDYLDRNKIALTNHQIREFEAQKKLIDASLLANAGDEIAVNILDDDALKSISAKADGYLASRDKTLPAVVRERNRKEFYSGAYKTGLYSLIANDQAEVAQEMFKKFKAEGRITASDAKAMENQITKAAVQEKASRVADELWEKTGGKDAEALAEIMKIKDKDERDATMLAYSRKSKIQKELVKAQIKTYTDMCYQTLNDDETNPSGQAKFPPEAVEFLRENAPDKLIRLEKMLGQGGGGYAAQTDAALYRELILKAANFEPEFTQANLNDYRDQLTKKDFNKLLTIQKNMSAKGQAAFLAYVNKQAKIDLKNDAARAERVNRAMDVYQMYMAANNNIPPDTETQKTLYSSIEHDFNPGIFHFEVTGSEIMDNPAKALQSIGEENYAPLQGVKGVDPFQLLKDARDALVKHGKPVTDENIRKVVEEMLNVQNKNQK